MTEIIARDPVPIIVVTLLFGGGALWCIVDAVASNWRKAVTAQAETALKQSMVEQGFSPDEIVRVLTAGRGKAPARGTPHHAAGA